VHTFTVLVLLVLTTVWALWFGAGRLHAVASAPVFDGSAGAGLPPLPAPATFVRQAGGNGLLVVDDGNGSPIAGTEVWQTPSKARQLDPRRCALWAHGDGALVPEGRPEPGHELVLRAPGHVATVLPALEAGTTLRVGMRPAVSQRVRCIRADGTPIEGARVVLARAVVPPLGPEACGLPPGGDPRSALYSARSGADGVALVSGLAPGGYAIQVLDEHHVVAEPRRLGRIDVPATMLEVPMLDLLGCVLTPPAGDQVEASGIRIAPGSLKSDAVSLAVARRTQYDLRRAHPGAFVQVLPGGRGVDRRQVRAKVLLRRLGFRILDVDLVPLRQLRPAPLPVAGDAAARAEVLVATGRPVPPQVGLRLRHDDGGVVCHVPLPLDQSVTVPAGTYSLDAENPVIRPLLPRAKFELRPDRPAVVPLEPGSWQVVRLHVTTPADEPVGSCAVQVLRGERRMQSFMARDSADIRLVVPAGPVTVRVEARGFVPAQLDLLVSATEAGEPIDLRLDYGD